MILNRRIMQHRYSFIGLHEACYSNQLITLFGPFLNRGQAEKEFKVEVEAIGQVKHKNLVSLLGYCAEGTQRYPVSLSFDLFLLI